MWKVNGICVKIHYFGRFFRILSENVNVNIQLKMM